MSNPFDTAYDAAVPPQPELATARGPDPLAQPAVAADQEDDADDGFAAIVAFEARVDAIVDGVYFNLPQDVYRAVPRLSASFLKKVDVSPADAWKDSWLDPNPTVLTEEQAKKKEEALRIGSAYHTARLEPHLFEALYVRELSKLDFPQKGMVTSGTQIEAALAALGEPKKRSGEAVADQARRLHEAGYPGVIWTLEVEAWRAGLNGRIPLTAKVWDEIMIDMQRLHSAGSIRDKLTGGAAEVSVFWTDRHGMKMKARIDYLRADCWSDLKTFANPNGKKLAQVLADTFRYNRYHMQAFIYRDAVETIRVAGLQIVGDATDEERALIAAIQIAPDELPAFFIFQQKGGVPNLLSREVEWYDVPLSTRVNHAGASAEGIARVEAGARRRTQLYHRAEQDVDHAKRQFDLYSQVYQPGEPWRPIEAEGTFGDIDFNKYWLEGVA